MTTHQMLARNAPAHLSGRADRLPSKGMYLVMGSFLLAFVYSGVQSFTGHSSANSIPLNLAEQGTTAEAVSFAQEIAASQADIEGAYSLLRFTAANIDPAVRMSATKELLEHEQLFYVHMGVAQRTLGRLPNRLSIAEQLERYASEGSALITLELDAANSRSGSPHTSAKFENSSAAVSDARYRLVRSEALSLIDDAQAAPR